MLCLGLLTVWLLVFSKVVSSAGEYSRPLAHSLCTLKRL